MYILIICTVFSCVILNKDVLLLLLLVISFRDAVKQQLGKSVNKERFLRAFLDYDYECCL